MKRNGDNFIYMNLKLSMARVSIKDINVSGWMNEFLPKRTNKQNKTKNLILGAGSKNVFDEPYFY